jgi:primosomal replication protein N
MELSGMVAKPPVRSLSPAGVAHCHFVVEHRSTVLEANLPRQVYCRMTVVISGPGSQEKTQHLVQGSNIQVGGFVAYQTGRNGVGKLVLHADNITQF